MILKLESLNPLDHLKSMASGSRYDLFMKRVAGSFCQKYPDACTEECIA